MKVLILAVLAAFVTLACARPQQQTQGIVNDLLELTVYPYGICNQYGEKRQGLVYTCTCIIRPFWFVTTWGSCTPNPRPTPSTTTAAPSTSSTSTAAPSSSSTAPSTSSSTAAPPSSSSTAAPSTSTTTTAPAAS